MLRIKEILKEKKISQIELAEKLEITTVGLNKIINGNPTADSLLKISEALNVDIKDLFQSTRPKTEETIYVKNNSDFVAIGTLKLSNE